MNNDGKPDLITTQGGSNMVSVFLNNNGTFPAGPSGTFLTGGGVNSVVTGDFDEDGLQDIATANCGNSPDPPQTPIPSSVSILFNAGGGTFKPHQDYPLPGCPDSIGRIIASPESLFSLIVSYGGPNIILLMNNGLGQFTERTIAGPAGSSIIGVSSGDYNGDGLQDIAAILNGNSVAIFYQNPDGTFSAPTTIFSKSASFTAANTVGFNASGRPDLLVPFSNAPGEPPGVIALTNNGGGNFSSIALHVDPVYNGDIGHKAAEGDLQNTGLHSVVLPIAYLAPNNQLFNAFAVFTQPSKGVWNGPIYLAGDSGGTATSAVVADFNGDGRPDIAASGGEDSHLFVFRNTTAAGDCTFFAGSAGVHVCSPASGATVPSPVAINSAASGIPFPIVAIKAYIDGTQVAATETNTMRTSVAKAAGNHQLAVNAWDSNDKVYQTIVNFTVGSSTACSVPTTAGVHICKPAAGSTVTSPVAISAAANGGTAKISAMKAYIDSKLVASSSSGTLNGSAVEAVGSHHLTVNAWNTAGKLFQSSATFTVH